MNAAPEDVAVAALSAHGRALQHAELDAGVREKAVHCLLDAVGLAVAAREHPSVRAAQAVATPLEPHQPGVELWAGGQRVAVGDALLANGIATHAHFQDDTDMDAWAHPGSLVVPAALGLARHRGAGLEAAVRGVVAGYSALNWLGAEGAVGRALVERGFRAGPCLGSIAAAVAAITILRLDDPAARSAVGLAADVTGAVLEPVRSGAQDWRWQNGVSAWRGATGGRLAEAGLTGPAMPLTGPRGFLAAFCGGLDVPAPWLDPPRAQAVHRVWFKPYPLLGDNMAAAVAAAGLHPAVAGRDVGDVEVHINAHFAAYPGTAYSGPFDTVEQAIASTAFAVAALLRHGDLRYAQFPARLADPELLALVARIRVIPEPDFDYLDAQIRVRTTDGAVLSRHSRDEPREMFFRDRATTTRAFATATADDPRRLADLPEALFAWLDGGPEPDLFARLVRSAP